MYTTSPLPTQPPVDMACACRALISNPRVRGSPCALAGLCADDDALSPPLHVNSEFRIISGRQTWDQARGRCQAIGGDLASAHTIWHARAIYTTVIEARMWRAWIGLRDRTETNHFQWSDDTGSPDSADFAGWHRGFPMHTTAITEDHQNCAGVLGMYKTAASPGSWFNAHCDDIGMYACNPVDGEGSGGVKHNVVSARDFASCRNFVVRHHPLADGITYDPGTRACWAHFGMESIGSSCQGCQACQRTPIDDSVGFVCGIPTGNTAAPTTASPPVSPPHLSLSLLLSCRSPRAHVCH